MHNERLNTHPIMKLIRHPKIPFRLSISIPMEFMPLLAVILLVLVLIGIPMSSAPRIPAHIATCGNVPNTPLFSFGLISPIYVGTMTEAMPIPSPHRKRPTSRCSTLLYRSTGMSEPKNVSAGIKHVRIALDPNSVWMEDAEIEPMSAANRRIETIDPLVSNYYN